MAVWVSLDKLLEATVGGYKIPTPGELRHKVARQAGKKVQAKAGKYKVPTPDELRKKHEKEREKEKKKKERAREKEKNIKKQKAKKKSMGGMGKKPPKQKPKPGGSKAKAKVDQVPAQLMHCVLAVRGQQSKKKPGGKPQKKYDTRAAWNICRWSLTRYGYLKPPYKKNAKVTGVRRTQKGNRASMKHAMEKEGPMKYKRFKDLFREIEPTV